MTRYDKHSLAYDWNYLLACAACNNTPGLSHIHKYGANRDLDADVIESIWSYGGTYYWSTGADIDTVSSSSVNDTVEMVIIGLDVNYNEVSQTITLEGQDKVTLPISLTRCYRAYNNNGTDLEGSVYVYENGDITNGVPDDFSLIRAYVEPEDQQTLMAAYTIPAGYCGLFVAGHIAISGRKDAQIDYKFKAREFNKIWRTQANGSVSNSGSSSVSIMENAFMYYPEKTDICFQAISDTNDTGLSVSYDILLMTKAARDSIFRL